MLAHDELRIVHATLHCSVAEALRLLTPELVEAAIRATHSALLRFGIERPRIGVFGINPHAGEGGLFGEEDFSIVSPAVQRAVRAGMDVSGPTGCDLLLTNRAGFDGFVAMFHDQGHAPIKLLGGRQASALSIGNRVTLLSVGHGAAFDIAGKGVADIRPLVTALTLASSMMN
jgi:4-hydroxythreonine-4-phosphate dehydrogenase